MKQVSSACLFCLINLFPHRECVILFAPPPLLGSGGFDMHGGGYKDSMSGLGGYGGGSGHMKRGLSGASLLSSTGTHADAVIAKINQRLDMLTQLEGGFKGGRSDR